MSGSYSLPLVFLSILLATAMSFVALRMVDARSSQVHGTNAVWVAVIALVLGTGIWSMHFVGMLAFRLPVPVGFGFTTTLASWAAAVLVCWLGLTFVTPPNPSGGSVLVGAMLMGVGIAVMHYSGMSAMQMSPPIRYRPVLAALSVIIGMAASYVALRMVTQLRATEHAKRVKQVGAACVMGLAVSGLHYTAMAAAIFAPNCISRAATDFDERGFVFEIFIAILAVLGLALMAALVQTRKEARIRQNEQSRELSLRSNQLMASEQRFKAAQEVAVDPFVILKAVRAGTTVADFSFDYANPAALRFWGVTERDVIGQRFLSRFPSTLANGLFAVYARVLADGVPTTVEQEYVGDGISGWFRITCVRLFDGVAITFADITERKAFEKLTAIMLDEQSRARELAEKENVTKDAFIAAVSHELRNPLNVVLSWVEVLKRTAASSPSTIDNALRRIEDSTRAQARLVNDLLDASAVAQGKVHLATQPVNLAELVRLSVADAATLASKNGITVRLETAHTCVVAGDEQRLRQVLANVLQNAVKFSNHGDAVTASVECHATQATIEVKDNGMGVDAAALPHIFERFAQADTADQGRFRGGVGLGLAISKRLVEAHGGTIEAFSKGLGMGTTVRISLPVAADSHVGEKERSANYF
ncbi:integral membrane sensor signal transduction histidine kinase [Caballeronia temeraria]|uniref:histidine kinase n=2 Tax=Caballeronia temeraria TaxID=1777137 RepID=A0A158C1S1_9BURK|nr:integral membrane sensor signal transduction histidine kinase [Caballeronia temeraria]